MDLFELFQIFYKVSDYRLVILMYLNVPLNKKKFEICWFIN